VVKDKPLKQVPQPIMILKTIQTLPKVSPSEDSIITYETCGNE
jgi:hypothetical protein